DQAAFLGADQGDKLLVVRAAAALPARRQRRERSYIATAELAPQPLDATDTRRLPPQVAARMLKTVAPPTGDHVPQVHVPATPTEHRALKPRPTNARHGLIPRHRNSGSIDPNIGCLCDEEAGFFTPLEPRRCAFDKPATLQQVPDVEARVGLDEQVERKVVGI